MGSSGLMSGNKVGFSTDLSRIEPEPIYSVTDYEELKAQGVDPNVD